MTNKIIAIIVALAVAAMISAIAIGAPFSEKCTNPASCGVEI